MLEIIATGFMNLNGSYQLETKTFLTGKNGAGKTALLTAIAAAIANPGSLASTILNGKTMGSCTNGVPSVVLMKDGLEIARIGAEPAPEWRVVNLTEILAKTGPAAIKELAKLVGSKEVTREEIIAELSSSDIPADALERILTTIKYAETFDAIAKIINSEKRSAAASLKHKRELAKGASIIPVSELEAELAVLQAQQVSPDLDRKVKRLAEVSQRVTSVIPNIDAVMADHSSELIGLRETLATIEKEQAETMVEVSLTTIGAGDKCPTCNRAIPAAYRAKMDQRREKVQAKRAQLAQDRAAIAEEISIVTANLDLMTEFVELRKVVGNISLPEDRDATAARVHELIQLISRGKAAGESVAAEVLSKAFNKAESIMKQLEARAVSSIGIPDSLNDKIRELLGLEVTFDGKALKLWSSDTRKELSVASLSAGQFAVLSALFATVWTKTIILIEAAEIDDVILPRLQQALVNEPQPVIMASWLGAHFEPGWSYYEVEAGKIRRVDA